MSMRIKPSRDEGVWGVEEIRELEKEKGELEDKASRPSQWGLIHANTFKALSTTRKFLPAGVYSITRDNQDGQPIYSRKEVKADTTLISKNSLAEHIISEINEFWGRADLFKKHGFIHSRGYLLYGGQGVGKSSIVQQVMSDVVNNDGIVFLCDNPAFFNLGLKTLRQTEPNRQLVCVFEDIDAIIKKYGDEDLLSILDGANQIDRVLNIATTNYPEMLDKRIISRPRRFDRVYKIDPPDVATRTEYLRSKLSKKEDLKKWVVKTKGLSFAGLAEALISVLCLGNKFEDTIKILKDLENGHPNSSDFGNVGFGKQGEGEENLPSSVSSAEGTESRVRRAIGLMDNDEDD